MKRIKLSEITTGMKRKLSCGLKPTLYFGADPEFFVANKKGTILNSDKFFPHKTKPLIIKQEPDDRWLGVGEAIGKLYFDGIQAEFGITPTYCRVYFIMRTKRILTTAADMIEGNRITLKPSVKVQKRILDQAHDDAKIFGCMPDYNAYTLTVNTPEMNAEKHPYRYAGGHIHIGLVGIEYGGGLADPYYSRQREMITSEKEHIRWVKSLDFFVNLLTLPFDNSPAAKRRRSKYGKAGCFRPTPYGIEYRSLSCWWLKSPIFVSMVLGLASLGTAFAYRKYGYEKLLQTINISEEDVRGAINESDVVYAKKVWRSVRALIGSLSKSTNFLYSNYSRKPHVYSDDYVGLNPITLFDYLIMNGTDELISSNMYEEWALHGNRSTYYYNWGNSNSFLSGTRRRLTRLLGVKKALRYEESLVRSLG